jgi:5,10-methylene-tetrahydrofolate dehydrogenase/methenyl tetrahydrofolate cyclohydrolase
LETQTYWVCFAANTATAQVNNDYASDAYIFSKKSKDDDIMITSSYHLFTFDKSKNALDEKVVTI